MSDEGRRVFPMESVLGVIAGQGGADVNEFMGYLVGRTVCDCCRPALGPMVKGWLYTLNPEFMKLEYNEGLAFERWATEQKQKLGDNVSIEPLPVKELGAVNAMLDLLEGARKLAEDKSAETEEALAGKAAAEAEAKALAPFKKKAETLEAKVAQLEEKSGALNAELSEVKDKLAAFDGKVAVDEKEIEKSVKDIVSRAVGSLAAAGGVAVAAEGEAAPAEEAGAAAGGGVPDDFGFGTSGANDDGFGF